MGGRGSKSNTKLSLPAQTQVQTAKPPSQMMQLLSKRITNAEVGSMSDQQVKQYTKNGYRESRTLEKKYSKTDSKIRTLDKKVKELEPLVKKYNHPGDKNELAKARRSITKNKKILRRTNVEMKINTANIVKGLRQTDKRGINLWG